VEAVSLGYDGSTNNCSDRYPNRTVHRTQPLALATPRTLLIKKAISGPAVALHSRITPTRKIPTKTTQRDRGALGELDGQKCQHKQREGCVTRTRKTADERVMM
jgi:hypothetical protein